MGIDLNKALGKGRVKMLMREAFIAGGRYYLKSFGKGNIPVKDLGEVQDFDQWFNREDVQEKISGK